MKNVVISLKGIQTNIDNETSTVELMSEAKFYKKGDSYYIVYNETELTGMEGTTTTIKITNEAVHIIRFGNICSNMIFKKGYKHTCNYGTAYGGWDIVLISNIVDIKIDDSGGELYLEYDIEIEGQKLGLNNFFIKIM